MPRFAALFVIPQDANHAAQRLNPLAGKRSIYFGSDGFGGFVAKLLRSERRNVLGGGWGRTPSYDPLQRDEENPIHICFQLEALRASLSAASETGSIHEIPSHHTLSDRLRRSGAIAVRHYQSTECLREYRARQRAIFGFGSKPGTGQQWTHQAGACATGADEHEPSQGREKIALSPVCSELASNHRSARHHQIIGLWGMSQTIARRRSTPCAVLTGTLLMQPG